MKTLYKPYSILSPLQTKQKIVKHPVREEIEKCVGTYNLTAVVEEDIQTQSTMNHINGLISFLCTLLKDGIVVSQGRGSSVLSPSNKFLSRAVASAFNSALADAAIRATKVMDTLRTSAEPKPVTIERYETKDIEAFNPITSKQRSYLLELINMNIDEEGEREKWQSQLDSMSREDASEAIQMLVK